MSLESGKTIRTLKLRQNYLVLIKKSVSDLNFLDREQSILFSVFREILPKYVKSYLELFQTSMMKFNV